MATYNQFAISENDLIGKWGESTTSAVSLYNVYDGSSAGMNFASLSDEFIFRNNATYQSNHSGASGRVGNTKFSSSTYKGKSVVTDWEVKLTDRFQGETDTFSAYFEAIKGGRILHMQDTDTQVCHYHLFKIN